MGDVVLEVAVQEKAYHADRRAAFERFEAIRRETEALTANLTPEDQSIQSMPDVSPTKWHLGHATWFFETFLLDIKHVFSLNPLLPAYQAPQLQVQATEHPLNWVEFDGGLKEIGHSASGFAFDNESPRHKIWLDPFRLASRPATCGEYLGFIEDAGYRRPEFWLSDGWATVREQCWEAPLYWLREGGEWSVFTLSGRRRLSPAEPLCPLSFC